MTQVTVTTKDLRLEFDAATGQEAVQMFFDDVKSGKVDIHDLGFIGTWTDGKEDHPFRIGPALFKCGLLSEEDLKASFAAAELEFDSAQIEAMANADAWMVRQ